MSSPLLGFATPTQGSLSGTWGTTVNDAITKLIDSAIAGTTSISTDADFPLTPIPDLPDDARQAILLCTGARTAIRTMTAYPRSKVYVIINATTGGYAVKLVATGPTTGVSVGNGKAALVAWNGSDFQVIASTDLANMTGTLGAANGGTGVANNSANTITFSGNYGITFTLTGTTSITFPTSGTLITNSSTATLTNKRIDPRVSSTASASSVTPDISAYDMYAFNALAAGLTINAPVGTPVDGDKLYFRILDNGTSRTLTWDATYTQIGVPLPTATTINKTSYVGCIYNANATRWDVVSVTTQF